MEEITCTHEKNPHEKNPMKCSIKRASCLAAGNRPSWGGSEARGEPVGGRSESQDSSFVGYSGGQGRGLAGGGVLTHISAPGGLGQGGGDLEGSRPSWGGPEACEEPAGGRSESQDSSLGGCPVLPQAKYDAPSHYSIIYVAKPVEIVSGGSVLLGCWGAFGWNPFCMLGHVYGMLGHVWTPPTPAFANHPCMFSIF